MWRLFWLPARENAAYRARGFTDFALCVERGTGNALHNPAIPRLAPVLRGAVDM
jgi:hypothetical protein